MAKTAKKAEVAAGAAVHINRKILSAYKEMLSFQFLGTLILALGFGIWLLVAYFLKWEVPLLLLVVLAGILGAFFSALTRLYKVDEAGAALISPTIEHLGGWYLLMYSFVPPVIGAIASVVLYLIFVGKMMSGGLFPDISCMDGKTCGNVQDIMHYYWPKTPEDYGKALVWAFIAGFSERLVPDLLQSLVAKQEKKGGGGG
jgi:hypothetical protein